MGQVSGFERKSGKGKKEMLKHSRPMLIMPGLEANAFTASHT